MARMFWVQYQRELAYSRWQLTVLALVLVILYTLLSVRGGAWTEDLVNTLALLPVVLVPLWGLVAAFQSWWREWQQDTVQLTLSLPVRASCLLGAKLLAVVSEMVFIAAIWAGGLLTLIQLGIFPALRFGHPLFWKTDFHSVCLIGATGLFFVVLAVLIIQLAYIVARVVGRCPLLVMPVTMLVVTWLIIRVAPVVNYLFLWVPPLVGYNMVPCWGETMQLRAEMVSATPFASTFVLGAALFLLTARLIERDLDV